MLLHQVASARADFTGEPLEAVRSRVGELADWARLIPAAGHTQALLESLLLPAIALSTQSLAAFGIAEVHPRPNRLDVHVTGPEVVVPFLELLPYRYRAREVHGVQGLLARARGRALHVVFDHRENEGLLSLWSQGVDLAPLLAEHQAMVEASGHRPLWTQSTPRPTPKGGRRALRRRSKVTTSPVTVLGSHRTSLYLASALLRRPGMWQRLAGHDRVVASTQHADHGLDWHIDRCVAPGHPVHDERIPLMLGDALAGPDLVMDKGGHDCQPTACTMRFIPRCYAEGWDGLLTVRTTSADSGRPADRSSRQARPFTVLKESLTPNGPVFSKRVTPSSANGPKPDGSVHGRVVQLESPPLASWRMSRWKVAVHLGAAWALRGQRVLIVRDVHTPGQGWPRDPFSQWPSKLRPEAPTTSAPWQRLRLVPGSGDLYVHEGFHSIETLEEMVPRARRTFDWIILVDDFENHMCPAYLDGIADHYVLTVEDAGFDTSVSVTHTGIGGSRTRDIPLSPAEAAMAWRERVLWRVPLDNIPVSGLLLVPARNAQDASDDFTAQADQAVERLGTPILCRFTDAFVTQNRTVLDDATDHERDTFIAQAMTVAAQLRGADSEGHAIASAAVPSGGRVEE
ncbi:hypothetical protein ABZ214_38825 [Streptomyces iakyrus]|uniref:hypothetical protein n=1 Tax=Streptomyces iakyrus TaxID=68219 RepID=UPI0033AB4A3C